VLSVLAEAMTVIAASSFNYPSKSVSRVVKAANGANLCIYPVGIIDMLIKFGADSPQTDGE